MLNPNSYDRHMSVSPTKKSLHLQYQRGSARAMVGVKL
jgi:hypothetical protein